MSESAEPNNGPAQPAVPPPLAQSGTASQDGPARADQSAINAYDMMLQEKERVILQNIAKKRSKIHEVEKQLSELQTALHVNVGPRRQALEHLRSLIEQQNHELDAARTKVKLAKEEMEHWQVKMQEAQQRKDQLALELTLLVQQTAGAQLKKLEELSEELEHLTDDNAANGRPRTAGNGQGTAAAGPTESRQQIDQAPTGPDQQLTAEQQQQQEQEQRKLQRQQQAAGARGRHVQLQPGRKAGGGSSSGRVAATRIPPAPVSKEAASGPFKGFE